MSAGTLEVSGTLDTNNFSNAGTVQISGSVAVSNDFTNTGTVEFAGAGGYLTVNGTTSASSLENISGPDGFLTVTGTVMNAGGTLDGTSLTARIMSLGTLEGGTVTNLASPGIATLDGVTWQGPLVTGGSLTITDGLTLTGVGGVGPGTLTTPTGAFVNSDTLQLEFTNSQTFDNATVSAYGTITADNTLTLGTASTLDVALNLAFPESSGLQFSGDAIFNFGTVFTQSSGGITFSRVDGLILTQATDFENFGVIDAADMSWPPSFNYSPGQATISIEDATFVNHAGGVIEVGQSLGISGVTIAATTATTAFTNDGTMLTQDGLATSTQGGTIDIAAILDGGGTVEVSGDGVVRLESAASSGQSLDFTGGGTLVLDQPAFVPSTINGFEVGDQIQLGVAATAVSYTSGDLKMQLGGGSTFDLAITGSHSLSDFVINTGAGSTDIALACFAAGTRLATTRGMVAVKALREGDAMLLADRSGSLPVIWIGHRNLVCRHQPTPRKVWPVRIAAGAFAAGVPRRDLYLSPDHAVFADGVLIPAKHLVNDRTITQVPVERVSYWHVELPRHAVLLAEGLSVESLLPSSDRSGFANCGGVVALHPEWAWEGEGYAPLVVTGAALAAVRARLARRAIRCTTPPRRKLARRA